MTRREPTSKRASTGSPRFWRPISTSRSLDSKGVHFQESPAGAGHRRDRSGSVREGSIMSLGPRAANLVITALGTIVLARWADAQGTPSPRPGLTAQQTKEAIEISSG